MKDPGGPSVLIVDDEILVAEGIRQALSLQGVPATIATSPQMAKERLAEDPDIGVVLADINMPGQNGLDMAADIRAGRPETAALDVVFMTGEGAAEHAVEALRRQAFDFLPKPFRMRELLDVVARAREANGGRRRRAREAAAIRDRLRDAQDEGQRLTAGLAASRRDLERTKAALNEAQEARSQLFAVISHELRTPLIPIIGFSDILLRNPAIPPETLAEMVGAIRSGGERLLGLIENALDILEIEAPETLRITGGVRPTALLGEAAARLMPAAQACGVALIWEGSAPNLRCDQQRVGRALEALIDNAIRATPPGAEVRATCSADADGVVFAVQDAGTGVPDRILTALGLPFLQGDMSLTRRWSGAGLGLAFVKRVAEAHGGALALTNKAGGACATLRLPMRQG